MDIQALNERFAVDGRVSVRKANNDLPFVYINNKACKAVISLYGGQLLSYSRGDNELLFLSEAAYYEVGKSIKGGVPICWPAFGASSSLESMPFHGFARNRFWSLESIEQASDSETSVTLELSEDESSLAIWPYQFKLRLKISLSEKLKMELVTENTGEEIFELTQAFHSYFKVSDISQVEIAGLENTHYLDKAKSNQGKEQKVQSSEISIDSEVDRIYLDVGKQIRIREQGQKIINIHSSGSRTAIVWNPWEELSSQSGDLQDDDYKRFVCVETANASKDIIRLEKGEKYKLQVECSLESNSTE